MSIENKIEEIESFLSENKADPPEYCYVGAPEEEKESIVWDEGASYCETCGEKALAGIQSENPGVQVELIFPMTSEEETEGCRHCEACGILLQYNLGYPSSEIDHFLNYPPDEFDPCTCYHLDQIYSCRPNRSSQADIKGKFEALTAILHKLIASHQEKEEEKI